MTHTDNCAWVQTRDQGMENPLSWDQHGRESVSSDMQVHMQRAGVRNTCTYAIAHFTRVTVTGGSAGFLPLTV